MSQNIDSFTVDVVGDVSGESFKGVFKTKTRLSHRDQLEYDRIRRRLLGDEANPSSRALVTAEMIAQLAVRITDGPGWWTDSIEDGLAGMGLSDDNVLNDVYVGAVKADKRISERLSRDAEQAKKDLKGTKVEGTEK